MQNPVHAFEAHQAALERSITAGRTGPAQNAPVPLVLPAGTLPSHPTSLPAAPAPAATLPNGVQPTEISQKMLDALDKYMQMEREKKADPASPPAAGSSVDMAL